MAFSRTRTRVNGMLGVCVRYAGTNTSYEVLLRPWLTPYLAGSNGVGLVSPPTHLGGLVLASGGRSLGHAVSGVEGYLRDWMASGMV